MALDFSRCRLPPFQHQREDVVALIAHPYFFIASEMRTGKSKIVIEAAQFMFDGGIIDRVIVLAPAPVRDVWYDRTLGELAKHLWLDMPARISEFHGRSRSWTHGPDATRRLEFIVSNFEYVRNKTHLATLLPFCGPKTLLVGDESSYLKNYDAQQTKAFMALRRACGRVVLLNGTPIFHSPMDLFSQANILHKSILDCPYVTHYRARYASMAPVLGAGGRALTTPRGKVIQKITGWRNLDDVQRRFAPCTVRRLQKDCLDLPPKLDPVVLTATMTPEEWRPYKDMQNDMVIWLQSGDVAVSTTAATKVMRLAQITSGFVGGIEDAYAEDVGEQGEPTAHMTTAVRWLGRSKLDVLLWFLGQQLEADEGFHVVAWCRFRPELFRMIDEVKKAYPQFEVAAIHGGQKKADRLHAMSLLKPETSPKTPVFVGGTFGTGSFGLDFTAAHTSVTCSSDYSPGRFAQSADRVYGPGQIAPIAYYDIVAVGPRGQRTIDHVVIEARRNGADLANWTAESWVKALTNEGT